MVGYPSLRRAAPSKRFVPRALIASAVGAAVVVACSKKNEIDVSSDVVTGVECTAAGDPACGNGGACVLGYCRIPCTGDDECPGESLCIGAGPFGCQLPWDAFCNTALPCKEPLVCVGNSCRMPCATTEDCPRGDHECIDGACFGVMEADKPDSG
jgi:hypothetical protein